MERARKSAAVSTACRGRDCQWRCMDAVVEGVQLKPGHWGPGQPGTQSPARMSIDGPRLSATSLDATPGRRPSLANSHRNRTRDACRRVGSLECRACVAGVEVVA